ncbi:MAG: hypothetical protein JEZ05_03575 [Tenericutes bacterium]|nr:hypothetical protein [Mycoplasmatota bacterium]
MNEIQKLVIRVVSIPFILIGFIVALQYKIYWLCILLIVTLILIVVFWGIDDKNSKKERAKNIASFRYKIMNGEIENPSFSTRQVFYDKDSHILDNYIDRINYDSVSRTNFVIGSLVGESFKYSEEIILTKNIKNSNVYSVIELKNKNKLKPQIIENHTTLASKYEKSYIAIKQDEVLFYIYYALTVEGGLERDEVGETYTKLIKLLKDIIQINKNLDIY